jgi:hypothetical protein
MAKASFAPGQAHHDGGVRLPAYPAQQRERLERGASFSDSAPAPSTPGFRSGAGFDFADFPARASQHQLIRFRSSDVYFRSASYNAYVQNDPAAFEPDRQRRVRYEFLTPSGEVWAHGEPDIAPGFAGVAVVTPQIAGPYTAPSPPVW